MKYLRRPFSIMAVLFAALFAAVFATAFLPALATASTAANTRITNTVTVYYQDTANQDQTPETASVDIVVQLVAVAPTLSSPADIDPASEDTLYNLVYTITSNANGPDTYNFSSADTETNMDADATFNAPSITLGGTTLAVAAVATDTFITVPMDDDYVFASNATVNGFTAGDTIMIGGNPYTVGTIDKTTSYNAATNTVEIPITEVGGLTGGAAIGAIIGERDTVTVTATTDTITTGTSGTHSVVTTAASTADPSEDTTDTVLITVRRPLLTVNKYVRNVTNPVVGAGPITIDTITWYATGVTGVTDDEMQYLIVVDNTAVGATDALDVVVEDPVPVFTTFVAASVSLDDDGTAADLASFTAQDETADDGDAAELDTAGNGTVYIYGGTGGDDTAVGFNIVGDGGTVAAGDISRMVFSVTID